MLSETQLDELWRRGHTRIPAVVDAAMVAQMQDAVWGFLETRGVRRDDPDSWPDTIDKLQPLRKQGVFNPFLGRTLDALSDQLIGASKWTDLGSRPQALMSMPTAGPWVLPHKVWHFDLPARGPTESFGAVRFLGFVDDVAPRGGGTVVVDGSHLLVRRMVEAAPDRDAGQSADARKRLASLPFFADLATPGDDRISRLMDRGDSIDGVDVRVSELTGRAGDLVVMHPWVMHSIAVNCSDRPRMMMSHTHYAADHSWH